MYAQKKSELSHFCLQSERSLRDTFTDASASAEKTEQQLVRRIGDTLPHVVHKIVFFFFIVCNSFVKSGLALRGANNKLVNHCYVVVVGDRCDVCSAPKHRDWMMRLFAVQEFRKSNLDRKIIKKQRGIGVLCENIQGQSATGKILLICVNYSSETWRVKSLQHTHERLSHRSAPSLAPYGSDILSMSPFRQEAIKTGAVTRPSHTHGHGRSVWITFNKDTLFPRRPEFRTATPSKAPTRRTQSSETLFTRAFIMN